MKMPDVELDAMDRDVARADRAWRVWRQKLAAAPREAESVDPLESWRHVAGKKAYDALGAFEPSALDRPERDGLRRWVLELTQRRVARPLDAEWELAAHELLGLAALPAPRRVSWREAWRELVAARDRGAALRFFEAACEAGPTLAPIERRRAEVRMEVVRRLGVSHPWEGAMALPVDALRAGARHVLSGTAELASSALKEALGKRGLSEPHPVDVIRLAVAREAPEGWPSRLTARWLGDVFGGLADGVALSGELPHVYGASSFARGLETFGRALRRSGASRALPYAVRFDPVFVEAFRFGLAFASLATSREFYLRGLGTSARTAAAQARTLSLAGLIEVRSIAARALLTDEARFADPSDFEELTAGLFGHPLSTRLLGAWPPVHGDEAARFVGLLGALPFVDELVQRFDVDWFANPRAATHLRSLAARPARDEVERPFDVDQASRDLARALEESLS